MFVKEAQPATVAASLNRAKIWEECHYDQVLTNVSMIQGANQPQQLVGRKEVYPKYMGLNDSILTNVLPIQSRPPMPPVTSAPPYGFYQSQAQAPSVERPKDPNETLLLDLARKMEELTVNMAKEKEKATKDNQYSTQYLV